MTESFSQVLSTLEYVVTSTAPVTEAASHAFLVKQIPEGTLLAVANGSGRGTDAQAAAKAAIAVIQQHAPDGVITLMRACHERLKGTRGAMVTLVALNGIEGTITWLGVGTIEGVLLRANTAGAPSKEVISSRPGVVGYRLPVLQATATPISPGDLIILYTEGIRSDFVQQFSSDDPLGQIGDYIASNARTGSQDVLVLVARFLGGDR